MTANPRHLFVLDPVTNLNLAWDTSIKIAFALAAQGAEVFCTTITELILASHPTTVSAIARRMNFSGAPGSLTLGSPEHLGFSTFDCVHMRKEPPYDLAYVEALWILAAAKKETRVLNDPIALQQINEKLVIMEFPEFSRPAMASASADHLAEFSRSRCRSDVVMKPLNLYGGRGVVHVSYKDDLKSRLEEETLHGTQNRLVQAYEAKVTLGEVRAFAVGGRPIAWCLKIPQQGDFLANTRAGSTLHSHIPTQHEIDVVTRVATELLDRGVMIAGFDLIDGWLSEVNITCPALLSPDRESLEGFDEIARRLIYSV